MILNSLLKKFVNKETLKKQIAGVEKHIMYSYECIVNLDRIKKNIENEEGTVLSKKKLPGLS